MRTRYLIALMLFVIIPFSCKDDNDDSNTSPITVETTPLQAGQIMTYSFVADDDTLVKMRDEVVDFGYTNFPVLMLVHKETLIQKAGWETIFHPVIHERLIVALKIWAREFNMNYETVHDKALVARNFLDYIVMNDLDVGILVDLIFFHSGLKLASIMEVVSFSNEAGESTNANLCRMLYENIKPEDILYELKNDEQAIACIMILANVISTIGKWCEFMEDNEPVDDPANNYASYLCSEDTELAHYSAGTPFRSRDYHLSYDAGLWEAKCTYHLEGEYDSEVAACGGRFMPHCNTLTTDHHVKGPGFVVKGRTYYSLPINAGSEGFMVPSFNGKVEVVYGDCCCFRKTSILNFRLTGTEGYTELTFDPGK